MDVLIPVMDSLQASKKIRAYEHSLSRNAIIFSLTAEVDDDQALCLQAGMNNCLIKPVERGALFATIEKFVN